MKSIAVSIFLPTPPLPFTIQSVLLMDSRDDFGNIEVPGLVPLGDVNKPVTLYVLMYGREKGHVDYMYRLRDTMIELGTFDGNKFEKIAEQTMDFAFGSYGHQVGWGMAMWHC